MKREDVSLLVSFGELVGTTDLEGQLGICSAFAEKLREHTKRVSADCENRERLYSVLGISAGAVVAILLI